MPPPLENKIQEVQENFSTLLDQVTTGQPATLYQAESELLSAMLTLGKQFLELFIYAQVQAVADRRSASGASRPLHSYKQRVLMTVFGRLDLQLPYYYGEGSEQPLDEVLALPAHKHSDLLCEMGEQLSTSLSYAKSLSFLERFFSLSFAPDTLSAMVRRDGALVDAFYQEAQPKLDDEEAEILVVQADGKGVPMRRNEDNELKKKEAVVTGIYTISPHERRAEAVIASLFDEKHEEEEQKSQRPRPMNKHLWASLDGKQAALDRLCEQASRREAATRLALCDGAQALQEGIEARFSGDGISPNHTLILDFVHVKDHLWKLGTVLCHWTQKKAWVKARALELLKEPCMRVLERMEVEMKTKNLSCAQEIAAEAELGYFRRNEGRMAYSEYLAKGWPIATGVIEGACRHLVKARCEAGGMRWSQEGVAPLLQLRAVAINGHWDEYHTFRRARQYERRFKKPMPEPKPLEWKALAKKAA